MALTVEEEKVYQHARKGGPRWGRLAFDWWYRSVAKAAGSAYDIAREWLYTQAQVDTATGPVGGAPDWLAEHAKDAGIGARQTGESDASLRLRIQQPEKVLTVTSIKAAIDAILATAALPACAVVELPASVAHFGSYAPQSGTGGTFGVSGSNKSFDPTAPWTPPNGRYKIIVASATSGGNNGSFEVNGYLVNAATYINATGVSGADGVAAWSTQKLDVAGVVAESKPRAYFGRGYRMMSRGATIIVILPFGTTASIAAAVAQVLRQKKAAGVRAITEKREVA